MSERGCHLCSQIQGQPANDLIAAMLPDQPYVRRILLQTAFFAALPSLGPLVPGHSLICPKDHIESLAQLPPDFDEEFLATKAILQRSLAQLYEAPVHLFEHGMAAGGKRMLCTVSHSHLHLLPLRSPSEAVIVDDSSLQWIGFDGSLKALRELTQGDEYILYEAPDGRAQVLHAQAGGLESQYMRKLFARCVGRPDRWDWRAAPNASLADRDWRRFLAGVVDQPVPAMQDRG